jgi:hypothetical protein
MEVDMAHPGVLDVDENLVFATFRQFNSPVLQRALFVTYTTPFCSFGIEMRMMWKSDECAQYSPDAIL